MPADEIAAFRAVTWNVAGAKFLELPPRSAALPGYTREDFRDDLNEALRHLTDHHKPDVVLLQETVRYEESPGHWQDLIDIARIPGYHYDVSIAIDTVSQSHPQKWRKYRQNVPSGYGWPNHSYLAQGYGLLWKRNLPHAAIWEFEGHIGADIEKEIVHLETGLFTGSRDTEPRLAVVVHFVIDFASHALDIFVLNLHLTTLRGEREGSPSRDVTASEVRQRQLEVVTNGIVSRYNEWVPQACREQDPPLVRLPAVWLFGGDFNCIPSSREIAALRSLNFLDLNPNKGLGTKGSTVPIKHATVALDYLFAGPVYHSLDPYLAPGYVETNSRPPLDTYFVSDHFPLRADIPLMAMRTD